jgi:hypothetical protein
MKLDLLSEKMLLSGEIVGLAGLFVENRISGFRVGQGVAGVRSLNLGSYCLGEGVTFKLR